MADLSKGVIPRMIEDDPSLMSVPRLSAIIVPPKSFVIVSSLFAFRKRASGDRSDRPELLVERDEIVRHDVNRLVEAAQGSTGVRLCGPEVHLRETVWSRGPLDEGLLPECRT